MSIICGRLLHRATPPPHTPCSMRGEREAWCTEIYLNSDFSCALPDQLRLFSEILKYIVTMSSSYLRPREFPCLSTKCLLANYYDTVKLRCKCCRFCSSTVFHTPLFESNRVFPIIGRNEVGPRSCFYRCVWFCSQEGVCVCLSVHPPPGTPPGQVPPGRYTPLPGSKLWRSMSGRYASYWNASCFGFGSC